MTYKELFDKAQRLIDTGKITIGEYEEMTKPLDREVNCLDKIKAEIENDWQLKEFPNSPFVCGIRRAIEVIDKYKEKEK